MGSGPWDDHRPQSPTRWYQTPEFGHLDQSGLNWPGWKKNYPTLYSFSDSQIPKIDIFLIFTTKEQILRVRFL